jgi:hypothetical protein
MLPIPVLLAATVVLVVLFFDSLLHLSPLDSRPVMTDRATYGGSHNGMVCEMSSNASNHGALEASCGLRRLRRYGEQARGEYHFRFVFHGCVL